MRATFSDIKSSRLPNVLGVCKDSDEFKSYVNEAISRLIIRGKWKGSYQQVRLCVDQACITLPRQIAAIYDVAMCGWPTPVRNQWWEYLMNGDGIAFDDGHCSCSGPGLIDRGFYPLFSDIRPPNKYLRMYASVSSDHGKKILVQGYDASGQWIRSQESGQWIDGFYMTLTNPYIESDFEVKSVTGFQKPVTDGNVIVYEATDDDNLRQLGVFEPAETVPQYRRYFMKSLESCCNSDCNTTITGMAKLEFIPVEQDTDYLYIDNIPAIKEMAMSIRYGEMDTTEGKRLSELHEVRAVRELNHQKMNLTGNDSIAIGMKVFGSAHLERRRIGRLT